MLFPVFRQITVIDFRTCCRKFLRLFCHSDSEDFINQSKPILFLNFIDNKLFYY